MALDGAAGAAWEVPAWACPAILWLSDARQGLLRLTKQLSARDKARARSSRLSGAALVSGGVNAVNLKPVLGKIETDRGNSRSLIKVFLRISPLFGGMLGDWRVRLRGDVTALYRNDAELPLG
jgi:hypothetical protein